ncbi:IclR family transcriptional regulator [Schumannella sp. 10F1B-5-1]|uniref:IclR family transcriptional regulator n=1 Tax=Schumannella sp. 10F1B-5-1 TaxID=2590780 RepID=UPI0011313B38|nr:IclR family transcriptional regulator [Schumannella sp. 10F1B-5-1]TPW78251.1 IclR family transcriptional regulator [Schumannella sp. 10F1B-5-1]
MPPASPDVAAGDIQVIARCVQILRLFSGRRRSVRISDVTAELGLSRTTIHRYLSSMVSAGLLERDGTHDYRLGPFASQLGTLAINGLDVVEIADPYLRHLADTAAETSVLAVWGGRSPVVVRSHTPSTRTLTIGIRVGQSLNFDAAQSAVFSAFRADRGNLADEVLDQLGEVQAGRIRERIDSARKTGLAISDTVNLGARAVAAPIFDRQGMIVATMGIIGTVHTLPAEPGSPQLRTLIDTARELSEALGFRARERAPRPTT